MKLQPLLTEYLIGHGSLPLPGAGRLSVRHAAATFTDNQSSLLPPAERIEFSSAPPPENEQQELAAFIRSKLHISDQQTSVLLKEEGDLQGTFTRNKIFDWISWGSFQQATDGTISFTQADTLNKYLPAITVTSVQRQQEIKLVEEMPQEVIEEPVYEFEEPEKKDYWWIWAIAIFVVSVVLILLRYYYTN